VTLVEVSTRKRHSRSPHKTEACRGPALLAAHGAAPPGLAEALWSWFPPACSRTAVQPIAEPPYVSMRADDHLTTIPCFRSVSNVDSIGSASTVRPFPVVVSA
jgi:hypothetical protein